MSTSTIPTNDAERVDRPVVKTIRVTTEVYEALKRMKRVTQPGMFETFSEVLERVLTALGEDIS
jgi:hypothetical protein